MGLYCKKRVVNKVSLYKLLQDLQKEFARCRDSEEKRLDLSSSDVSNLVLA